jgi:hypothetical protein
MCAEKDPFDCHRTLLVARAFSDAGYPIIHLQPGGITSTQADIEQRLLNKYYPNRAQVSLIDAPLSDADCLSLAYARRNAEIGYRIEEEP